MAKEKDVVKDEVVVDKRVSGTDEPPKNRDAGDDSPPDDKNTDAPPENKEDKVLTAGDPVQQTVEEVKNFSNISDKERIKYLYAGLKFLIARMGGEDQVNFYNSYPELR